MIDALDFMLLGLASWRLAFFITNEDGPGNFMSWLRQWDLYDADADKGVTSTGEILPGSWAKLMRCVYCMSFWTALILAGLWLLDVEIIRAGIALVALWGAATALDMVARRDG